MVMLVAIMCVGCTSPDSKDNSLVMDKNGKGTFSTKFGSIHDEFIPYDRTSMTKFPLGIAHFLEHKLFEQKNGVDPFTFYSERGSDANANTSNFKTNPNIRHYITEQLIQEKTMAVVVDNAIEK